MGKVVRQYRRRPGCDHGLGHVQVTRERLLAEQDRADELPALGLWKCCSAVVSVDRHDPPLTTRAHCAGTQWARRQRVAGDVGMSSAVIAALVPRHGPQSRAARQTGGLPDLQRWLSQVSEFRLEQLAFGAVGRLGPRVPSSGDVGITDLAP